MTLRIVLIDKTERLKTDQILLNLKQHQVIEDILESLETPTCNEPMRSDNILIFFNWNLRQFTFWGSQHYQN